MASSSSANAGSGGQEYMLKRDFRSSIRLNYNHWLMRQLTGYTLHPSIKYEPGSAHIADVGTGTGLWLLELADHLPPTATLDGFDISSAQFPPPAWRGRANLMEWDAFKPFPEQYRGKYDVVHVRFFLCIVNNQDAEPLLENLVSLLKPGGYLQWFEPDVYSVSVKSCDPAASTTAMEKLVKAWHKPRPDSTYDWVRQLPQSFEKHGLSVEAVDTIPMKDSLRLPWAHSNLAGLQDTVERTETTYSEQAAGAVKFMNDLSAEFAQGVSIDTPHFCFIGRKVL